MGIKIKHFPEGVPTIHGDTAYWGVALDKRSNSYYALDLQDRRSLKSQRLVLSADARDSAITISMEWLHLSENRADIEGWISDLPVYAIQFVKRPNTPVITVLMDARRLGKPDPEAFLGVTDDQEVMQLFSHHLENNKQSVPRL